MVLGMETRCQGKQIKTTKNRMTTFLDCLGQYLFPFIILARFVIISLFSLKISWFGLLWWSSGEDSAVQGAGVQSLVQELRSYMPHGSTKKYSWFRSYMQTTVYELTAYNLTRGSRPATTR